LGRPQPLRVHGTCKETLSIADTRVNITIIGDGDGDCGNPSNTKIIGDDPSAAQIVQIRGKNITMTALEISGLLGTDPTVKPPLGIPDFDASQCTGSTGTGDAQDPNCNNNRGVRAQRGGIVLLGRNVTPGDFKPPSDPTTFQEQTGVCIHHVGKNGIEITAESVGRIINSEVHNVGGDGIVFSEVSGGLVGFSSGGEFNLPTDAYPGQGHSGPVLIHDNTGVGVTVDRLAEARIVGNFIHNNGGDGIRVRRNSQADIASNLINANGANGIRVDDNSNVSLGTTFSTGCGSTDFGGICSPPINQGNLANTTSVPNLGSFGVKCTVGGSVSGKLSTDRGGGPLPLVGSGSGANLTGHTAGFGTFGTVTNDNCIDRTN
jgi:hypothetical protein